MENISEKICKETRNTRLVTNSFFFPSENQPLYEVKWKNTVERSRSQMTVWCIRIACWVPKATKTHTGCVIPIAFPLQQWLNERALMLRILNAHCLSWCS